MERSEAFKMLRLDASADAALVESAYWQLVREAGRSDHAEAQHEIDQLNAARATLAPKGAPPAVMSATPRATGGSAGDTGIVVLEKIADWVWAEAIRTRMRWPGRNVEVVIIAGTAIVLMVLALGAGAPVWLTFGVVAALLASIWAPWRRV